MQRHPAFHSLSSEHHQALVVANRILKSLARPDSEGLGDLATRVAEDLRTRWERHFVCEERVFAALPEAARSPAAALIQRILEEHQALRALAGRLQAGDTAALAELAPMLRDHTHLEERELLPLLERSLNEADLARIGELWQTCDQDVPSP